VARTLADLDAAELVTLEHIEQASWMREDVV
jgi:hypothetical protein